MNLPIAQTQCPYELLEEAHVANASLIEACESLIARLESLQEEYNSVAGYANNLGKLAQKWQKKFEDSEARNVTLRQGLEFSANVLGKSLKGGVKNPLYLQIQEFLLNSL